MTRKYLPEIVLPKRNSGSLAPRPILIRFIQHFNYFVLVHVVVADMRQTGCRIDIESRLQTLRPILTPISAASACAAFPSSVRPPGNGPPSLRPVRPRDPAYPALVPRHREPQSVR